MVATAKTAVAVIVTIVAVATVAMIVTTVTAIITIVVAVAAIAIAVSEAVMIISVVAYSVMSTTSVAVVHSWTSMTKVTSVVPRATSVVVPRVTSSVGVVEYWVTKEEVCVTWVTYVDVESPGTVCPEQRAIEVACCTEC